MDDKQLYFKNKYLKYKLKYVTLKEQQEGGMRGFSGIASSASYLKDSAVNTSIVTQIKSNFDPEKILKYFSKNLQNDEDKKMYDKIISRDILKKIKYEISIYSAKDNAIDDAVTKVLKTEFPNKSECDKYKTYITDLLNKYNESKSKIDLFNPDETKQSVEDECLCHIIIKKDILKKIKAELPKHVVIEDAIDAVLIKEIKNDKELQKKMQANQKLQTELENYLKKMINIKQNINSNDTIESSDAMSSMVSTETE
jgi:hypothetical protein